MVKLLKSKAMKKAMKTLSLVLAAALMMTKSFGDVASFIYTSACDGSAVKFTSTSTVTSGTIVLYEWDFNADGNFSDATGPVVTKLFASAGSYPVGIRIRSSLNVVTTAYKTITVNPLAVASFTATDACLGEANTFKSTSTISGGSIVKYKWDFNNDLIYDDSSGTDVSRLFNTPGSYTVGLMVITDSGCISTVLKTVKVNPLPVVDFNFDKTCFHDTTEFTVTSSVAGGSISKYYWNFDGDPLYEQTTTSPDNRLSFIAPGNYLVQVKSESDKGCVKDTVKLVVIAPRPTLNFTFSNTCVGYDINIDNSFSYAKTYLWKFGDGNTSTAANPVHVYNDAGTYTIELSGSSAYGCNDMISKNITIHPTPSAGFNAQDVCLGNTVSFENLSQPNGAPIKDYYWDFDDNHGEINQNPKHLYQSPGTYQVSLIVANIFACSDTFVKAVNVWALPSVTITAGGPTEFCRNDSVVLTVSPAINTILWSTGENTFTITAKNSGKYRALVFDNHGCVNKDSIMVTVNELPVIMVSPEDTAVSLGKPVPLLAWGANTYSWSPPDYLDNAFKSDPVSLPLQTITYTVTGEDLKGCKNTKSLKVTVNLDYTLDLVNMLTPNGDGANDIWDIGLKYYSDNEVVIYDRWGVEVYRQKAYADNWDGMYKGNPVPEGTYYYFIRFDNSDKVYSGYLTILR